MHSVWQLNITQDAHIHSNTSHTNTLSVSFVHLCYCTSCSHRYKIQRQTLTETFLKKMLAKSKLMQDTHTELLWHRNCAWLHIMHVSMLSANKLMSLFICYPHKQSYIYNAQNQPPHDYYINIVIHFFSGQSQSKLPIRPKDKSITCCQWRQPELTKSETTIPLDYRSASETNQIQKMTEIYNNLHSMMLTESPPK